MNEHVYNERSTFQSDHNESVLSARSSVVRKGIQGSSSETHVNIKPSILPLRKHITEPPGLSFFSSSKVMLMMFSFRAVMR